MTKRGYYAKIAASAPLLAAALLVGVLEKLLDTDGTAALWLARPFLKTYERWDR